MKPLRVGPYLVTVREFPNIWVSEYERPFNPRYVVEVFGGDLIWDRLGIVQTHEDAERWAKMLALELEAREATDGARVYSAPPPPFFDVDSAKGGK